MSNINKLTLVIWLLIVILSFLVNPSLFSMMFPSVETNKLPGGNWYFIINLILIHWALRYVLMLKALLMLIFDFKKTIEMSSDEETFDSMMQHSKANYVVLPLAWILAFVYGFWAAISTTGITWVEGIGKFMLLNTGFVGVLLILQFNGVFSFWIFSKVEGYLDDEENDTVSDSRKNKNIDLNKK